MNFYFHGMLFLCNSIYALFFKQFMLSIGIHFENVNLLCKVIFEAITVKIIDKFKFENLCMMGKYF